MPKTKTNKNNKKTNKKPLAKLATQNGCQIANKLSAKNNPANTNAARNQKTPNGGWLGHTVSKATENIALQALDWNPQGEGKG